jgi:hypothetical protein
MLIGLSPAPALSSPHSIVAAALGCHEVLAAGCSLAMVQHGPVAQRYAFTARPFPAALSRAGRSNMHASRCNATGTHLTQRTSALRRGLRLRASSLSMRNSQPAACGHGINEVASEALVRLQKISLLVIQSTNACDSRPQEQLACKALIQRCASPCITVLTRMRLLPARSTTPKV